MTNRGSSGKIGSCNVMSSAYMSFPAARLTVSKTSGHSPLKYGLHQRPSGEPETHHTRLHFILYEKSFY